MDQVVYSNKGELQGEEDGDVDAHCSTYASTYILNILLLYCKLGELHLSFFPVHIYCNLKAVISLCTNINDTDLCRR